MSNNYQRVVVEGGSIYTSPRKDHLYTQGLGEGEQILVKLFGKPTGKDAGGVPFWRLAKC